MRIVHSAVSRSDSSKSLKLKSVILRVWAEGTTAALGEGRRKGTKLYFKAAARIHGALSLPRGTAAALTFSVECHILETFSYRTYSRIFKLSHKVPGKPGGGDRVTVLTLCLERARAKDSTSGPQDSPVLFTDSNYSGPSTVGTRTVIVF